MNNILNTIWLILFSITSNNLYSQNLSPIAYFKLDGDANDDSPFKNHGRIIGNVESTIDRFGNKNGALYFLGDGNSYIEIPSSESLESPESEITICGWFKLKSHPYSNYWLTLVCKGDKKEETSANPQYRFQVMQNYKPQFSSCSPNIETGFSVISLSSQVLFCDTDFLSHKFEPNEWHFYAISSDANGINVYYDGIKILSYLQKLKLEANKDPLFIGRDSPGIIDDFKGALDDIRIYNTCLSELDIYSIYSEKRSNSFNQQSNFQKTNNYN